MKNKWNILYFISRTCLVIGDGLFQASYYLGVGADMVLCIQQLPEQCEIGSDKVRLMIVQFIVI